MSENIYRKARLPLYYPLQMRSKYSRTHMGANGQYAAGVYFLLPLLLSLPESFLWNKIRG